MDSEGNIYSFKNHPDPQKFMEEYDLVDIADEDLPVIANMTHEDRKKWYKERKAIA